jgi:glycosyltransferase involved in cell wall biosynthesis
MKLISVITPCFNICKDGRLDYFKKMMDSVHNQSYINIEHIVVDGGSTDGTLSILEEYIRKGWITKLVSEKDKGVYEAMNKGIKLSKGNYINIMNTDDYLLDLNYFEKSISKLRKYDFVHADRIIKSRNNKKESIKKGNELNAFFRMPFRHQTMIIKKDVFNDVGLFDENYVIASDYKWVVNMLLSNKKGFYFPRLIICSLDGGVSSNRQKCIEEVSKILFESYGMKYNLSLDECQKIYLRKISFSLLTKIIFKVKNWKIKKSLIYCYFVQINENKNISKDKEATF